MTKKELQQVEQMKQIFASKGDAARKAAEGQQKHLVREISAMTRLNEDYNISRLAKFQSQLDVITEALKS